MSSTRRQYRGAGRRRGTKGRGGGSSFWGVIGVIIGIIVIILSVGYVVGAYYLTGILAEVAQKDFTPANQRLNSYEGFFRGLVREGLTVEKSAPYIREGVKYFLWTVTLEEGGKRLIYRWKHDLETNRVSPLTSPSTYLDIELGYIRRQQVGQYPYDPGDSLALQLAKGTYRSPPVGEEAVAHEKAEELAPEEPLEEQSPSTDEDAHAIEVGGGNSEDSGDEEAPPSSEDDGESGSPEGGESVPIGE